MPRLAIAAIAAFVLACLFAPSAFAAGARDTGDQVIIKGKVVLDPGERAGSIVIVDGDVTIPRGATATGNVVAVAGDVRLGGRVQGNVVTVAGRLITAPGARVEGNVRYGDERPRTAPGTVDGSVRKLDSPRSAWVGGVAGWLLFWAAIAVSMLILGSLVVWLAPRAADATAQEMRTGWGAAIGIGAVLCIGLPVLAILAMVTLFGLPFGIGLLLALLPLGALGYVTGMWLFGRWLVEGPAQRYLAFVTGWAILSILTVIPVLGQLTLVAATVVGLGALAVTLWRRRTPPPQTPAPATPAPA